MKNAALYIVNLILITLITIFILFAPELLRGQQPQVAQPNPQPLQGINSKWTNGVATGYAPLCNPTTCSSTLSLNVGPGTCFDSSMVRHAWAGSATSGYFTMSASHTNYVYLSTSACAILSNTTGYPATGACPLYQVVTSGSTITGITDDRTPFGGACGVSGSPTGGITVTHNCIITYGDPATTSPVLLDTNDAPRQCGNQFGADQTVIAVSCYADAGSPTVNPILTGGSGTSILTGNLTCGTASWAAGVVNGTPVIHSFSADGATCSSTPCTVDANIVTAGGTARYIVVQIATIGAPGTGSNNATVGGSSANQLLINLAGSVGGVGNATAGKVLTANGTSSAPTFNAPLPTSVNVIGSDSNGFPVAATGNSLTSIMACADSSGSGTAQSCDTSPTFTPATGSCVWYTTTTANSGTGLTTNINSLGAKSIAIPGASGWTTTLVSSPASITANKPLLACYDGTNWNIQQTGIAASGGSGALTKICSLTASTSNSLDFDSANCGGSNVFTSTYDQYELKCYSLVFAGTNPQINLNVSTNAGSTWAATGYLSTLIYDQQNAGGVTGTVNSTTSVLLSNSYGNGATRANLAATVEIFNPLDATNNKLFSVRTTGPGNDGNWYHYEGGGVYNSASAVNAIQVKPASSTITSGTCTLFGYQK